MDKRVCLKKSLWPSAVAEEVKKNVQLTKESSWIAATVHCLIGHLTTSLTETQTVASTAAPADTPSSHYCYFGPLCSFPFLKIFSNCHSIFREARIFVTESFSILTEVQT